MALGFVLILLIPIICDHAPQYYGKPDIQYVKAKVLSVSRGDIFGDPVTGFPNFHPPYYHLFLSLFTRLGIGIDTLLFLISVVNVCLLFVLSYLVFSARYERKVALLCALMIPFIIQHMGHGNMTLATAFPFSISFYLGGLYLYWLPETSRWRLAFVAVLWGCSFLISPVYVFVVGFTFIYELAVKRAYRRFRLLLIVFLATIAPFFVQMYIVYSAQMGNTSTFSLWRGIPTGEWFKTLAVSFVFPGETDRRWFPAVLAGILVIFGILGAIKNRPAKAYLIIAGLAYLFTAYHFSMQYAIRIQFFLSLLLSASAIWYLYALNLKRLAVISFASVYIALGAYEHFALTNELIRNREVNISEYRSFGSALWSNMGKYLSPGRYIVATESTYRYFIMPYFPAHALVAYRSGEYFQLAETISQALREDYNVMMSSNDIGTIERICRKYDMRTAVVHLRYDMRYPVFQAIGNNWTLVYEDQFFRIYQQPIRLQPNPD